MSVSISPLVRRTEPRGAPLVTSATIRVHDLRLRTFIGFNDDERRKQQDVVINLQVTHRVHPGVLDDEVQHALNYKVITKAVIEHVENGRFLLLEKLAADVLNICCASDAVTHASVTIDKPHALRFADSVSITLDFDASHSPFNQEKN